MRVEFLTLAVKKTPAPKLGRADELKRGTGNPTIEGQALEKVVDREVGKASIVRISIPTFDRRIVDNAARTPDEGRSAAVAMLPRVLLIGRGFRGWQ